MSTTTNSQNAGISKVIADGNDPATTGDNTPEDAKEIKEAKATAKEVAKAEKEYPVNPRFPGEGNPDFKG